MLGARHSGPSEADSLTLSGPLHKVSTNVAREGQARRGLDKAPTDKGPRLGMRASVQREDSKSSLKDIVKERIKNK